MMIKAAGAKCNLACKYCYYLEKSELRGERDAGAVLGDALLEKFVREHIAANPWGASFTWHGGEPLLAPPGFYAKAVKLQKKYANGVPVENCVQTNGTLLTDEWCRFFADNGWLVGISIDGPEDIHDRYRRSPGKSGSFRRVMRGLELLRKHNVRWNAMSAVTGYCAERFESFYDFFRGAGCSFLQFTPVVERFLDGGSGGLASLGDVGDPADFSVSAKAWGGFLCGVFDMWAARDDGRVFIQTFESTLANWLGLNPGVCSLSDSCGRTGVLSTNGDIYPCDHFVFEGRGIGNLYDASLGALMRAPKQLEFERIKTGLLPRKCRGCEFYFACKGECPRNRFAKTETGEPYLNCLCGGYLEFFRHVKPHMDYMKSEFLNGRPVTSVMDVAFAGPQKTDRGKNHEHI